MTLSEAAESLFRTAIERPQHLRCLEGLCPFDRTTRAGLTFALAMTVLFAPDELRAAREDMHLQVAIVNGLYRWQTTPVDVENFEQLAAKVAADMEQLGIL